MVDGYNATYSTTDASEAGTDVVVGVLVQIAQLIGVIVIIVILGMILTRLRGLGKFGR